MYISIKPVRKVVLSIKKNLGWIWLVWYISITYVVCFHISLSVYCWMFTAERDSTDHDTDYDTNNYFFNFTDYQNQDWEDDIMYLNIEQIN